MAEQPPIQRPEQAPTPERSAEELYFDALEKKRDTLLAFHTMNSFRKGKSPENMTLEEVEQYKTLRDDWQNKKESYLGSWDSLSEDKQEELAAMGSRLYDVQTELTLLKSSKEVSEAAAPEVPDQASQETPISEIEGTALEKAETEKTRQPEAEQAVQEQSAAEKPESALSLADVDDYIARLEKSTPAPLLAIEAWKSKRAELAERQEAEANPDRTPSKGFLTRVKESYNRAKDAFDRTRGVESLEKSRMNPLGLRETPLPESIPEIVSEQREVEPKKPTKWGWFKERTKGVWNFGIWEFHQAERFRSKTREVAEDAKALATLVEEERDMTPEAAEKEAWGIVNELKSKGLDISAPEFYQVASELSEKKRKENDEQIEYIISSASNDLLDKLQKYRGQAGQDVLTEENKIAFQNDLRMELNKLRDGFLKQYTVDLAEVMRRNLDENWWRRYIWGAAEAAIGFAGVKFLTIKAADWWVAAKMAKATEAGVGAGTEAVKGIVSQAMDGSVWNTLEQMAEQGPNHLQLNPEELKSLSQRVLDFNGMYEKEWVNTLIEGLRSSRMLPQGFPLKIPPDVMSFLGY